MPDQAREKVGEHVSIFRRGKTWWASYQLDRRQQRESLETSNLKEARRQALIIEAELQQGKREVAPPVITIPEMIDEYLDCLTVAGRAPKTLEKYRNIFGRVKALAQTRRVTNLRHINLRFVDAYRSRRTASERSPKTIYCEITIIRQLINFAISRDAIKKDPLKGLKNPKPRPTKQPCWSPAEVERILTAAAEPQQSMLIVLADTGMRFGELQWLTWDDIDFEHNLIHIQAKPGWKPKSGDPRQIPISARLRALLEFLPHSHRWVVTAGVSRKYPQGGNQISERRLLTSLKRLLKRIGLPSDGKLHTFRHSFISRALANGTDSPTVRAWVGHYSDEILKIYTHTLNEHSQRAMQKLSESTPVQSSTNLAQSRKGDL